MSEQDNRPRLEIAVTLASGRSLRTTFYFDSDEKARRAFEEKIPGTRLPPDEDWDRMHGQSHDIFPRATKE